MGPLNMVADPGPSTIILHEVNHMIDVSGIIIEELSSRRCKYRKRMNRGKGKSSL